MWTGRLCDAVNVSVVRGSADAITGGFVEVGEEG